MESLQDIQTAVQQDVEAGLKDFLSATDFEFVDIFGVAEALVDGDFAAVQWVFEGVDCGGLNDMWATGKVVSVRGLTLIDTRTDEPRFSRHIDWNSVNSQLGGSRGRTSSTTRFDSGDDAKAAANKVFEERKAYCDARRAEKG